MSDTPATATTVPAPANRPSAGNRSPNYPQLSVGPAIDRAKKIYEKEYTHSMPAQVAVEALGYKSLSGTAKGVLSTLRKYGLVTFDGKDGYKVSDDTVAIAELPSEDPERLAAVRRVALRPTAYKHLGDKYGSTLPSEGAIRHFLIQSGYQSDGANLLIKVYKETLDFLAKIPATSNPEEAQPLGADAKTANTQNQSPGPAATPAVTPTVIDPQSSAAGTDHHQVPLSAKCAVEIVFRGEVTTEAIDRLKGYLDWVRGGYPSASETSQIKHHASKNEPHDQSTSLFAESDDFEEDDNFEEDVVE